MQIHLADGCKPVGYFPVAEMCHRQGFSIEELERTGERIYTMKRLFNTGHGLSRKDDSLPERILKEPRGSGGSADYLPTFRPSWTNTMNTGAGPGKGSQPRKT